MARLLDLLMRGKQGAGQALSAAENTLNNSPMLLNLLAQQGYSTMPSSPLAAVGRAGLATQLQEERQQNNAVKNAYMMAQAQSLLAPKGQERWRPPTPEEMELYNLQGDRAYRVNDATGEVLPIGGSPPVTNINMPPGVNQATSTFGTGVGERANSYVSQAQEASNRNQQLDRVALALSRGADTGLGAETLLNLKQFGNTFLGLGLPEEAQEQEIIRGISNEMALRLRNPDSGLGLTGNTSNRDLQFLRDSVIGLARSEGGNLKLIEFMKRKGKMQQDIAREALRIIQGNRNPATGQPEVPLDLDIRLMDYANNYEFFTPEERTELEQFYDPTLTEAALTGNSVGGDRGPRVISVEKVE